MADKLDVTVKLSVADAQKKLKKFKDDLAAAKKESKELGDSSAGLGGGKKASGRGGRLLRSRQSRSGGGSFGGLKGAAGKAGGILAAILLVIEVVKTIAATVDAIGISLERAGLGGVGKKVQSLAAGFTKFQSKVLSALSAAKAISTASKFEAAGIKLDRGQIADLGSAFANEQARTLQKEQRQKSRNIVNYGQAALRLAGF